MHTHTCAYEEVRNVNFSEYFAYFVFYNLQEIKILNWLFYFMNTMFGKYFAFSFDDFIN